jgi:hypothetical protein
VTGILIGMLLVVALVAGAAAWLLSGDRTALGPAGLGSLFGVLAIAAFVFWLWMLIDVVISDADAGTKVLWVLLIVFLGVLGALAYAIMGRPSRKARS